MRKRKATADNFKAVAHEPLIRFNNTYRDAIQSLFGTNVSSEEIVAAHPNAHKIGCTSLQTCGGTFYDIPERKGRDPSEFIKTLNDAYPGIKKTALFRGDCLLGYERQSFDVIMAMILEHARAGVNVIQNFHGLNDTRMTAAVAEACQIAREQHGFGIIAQGTICIEDNPNVTIESCLTTARELISQGHKGFYLKSASGRLKPEFVRELVGKLIDEFPNQSIDMHAHDLYGEAVPSYMAAIEAAVEKNHSIGIDVLHEAIAGNTAQPSMQRMLELIKGHHNKKLAAQAPVIDAGALAQDADKLYALRYKYRDAEICPSPRLLEAMYKARVPGGASATLRNIPNLESSLQKALGTTDWEEIQIAIYKMQERILPRLGNPTQVTPYALMTTKEAAFAILREKVGSDPLSALSPDVAGYLRGELGRVPESAEPGLIKLALQSKGMSNPAPFVAAKDMPLRLPLAKQQLEEVFAEENIDGAPSEKDILHACVLTDPSDAAKEKLRDKRAFKHVIARRKNVLVPQIWPDVTFKTAERSLKGHWRVQGRPGVNSALDSEIDQKILQVLKDNIAFLEQMALNVRAVSLYRHARFSERHIEPLSGTHLGSADYESHALQQAQKAREDIFDFTQRLPGVLMSAGVSPKEIQKNRRGINQLLANICKKKGVADDSIVSSLDKTQIEMLGVRLAANPEPV